MEKYSNKIHPKQTKQCNLAKPFDFSAKSDIRREFRHFVSGPQRLYYKIVNFCRTEAGLISKLGRASWD